MRLTIFTEQFNVRLTKADVRAIRASRRPEEQLSDTARRLIRAGIVASKSPENPPEKDLTT